MEFRLQKTKIMILAMIALMVFVAGCTTKETEPVNDPTGSVDSNQLIEGSDGMVDDTEVIIEDSDDVKTFVLTGENYYFEMEGVQAPEIRVKEGDKVRIEFSSIDGFHDFVIDEFGAATDQVRPNDPMTFVEFTASKSGSFEFYCSVGSHRANGMVGLLIVE